MHKLKIIQWAVFLTTNYTILAICWDLILVFAVFADNESCLLDYLHKPFAGATPGNEF